MSKKDDREKGSSGEDSPGAQSDGVAREPAAEADHPAEAEREDIPPDSELAEALREKDQFRALLQRTQADFINFRTRAQAEQDAVRQKAVRILLSKLIDVVDCIDVAMETDATSGVDMKFLEGVAAIQRSFETFLAGEGVEKFESVGDHFDPRRHEALVRTETEEYGPDTVIAVMRAGYRINDDILRPALVEVAASPVAPEADSAERQEED